MNRREHGLGRKWVLIIGAVFCAFNVNAGPALPETARVETDSVGNVSTIEGRLGLRLQAAANPGEGRELLDVLGSTLRATGKESLDRIATFDAGGRKVLRFRQSIDGVPVLHGGLIVHTVDDEVVRVQSNFVAAHARQAPARISGEEAAEIARSGAPGTAASIVRNPSLLYAPRNGALTSVWKATVEYRDRSSLLQMDDVFVDASDGAIIDRHPRIKRAFELDLYDASEGSWDAASIENPFGYAQQVVNHFATTYDYFYSTFGRDGCTGTGSTHNASIHVGENWTNAEYWGPEESATYGPWIIFGDGDATHSLWLEFGKSRDVVSHEFTHCVTDYSSDPTGINGGLVYESESGAMNESYSDVFAAAVNEFATGTVSASTWLIADEIYTPNTSGDGLRRMDQPHTTGNDDWYCTPFDSEVHDGSGISNLAFYLLSQGGSHPRGMSSTTVTGVGLDDAARIYYWTLPTLTEHATFDEVRTKMIAAATDHASQLASGSAAAARVASAWSAVGVTGQTASPCPPPPSVLSLNPNSNTSTSGVYSLSWTAPTGANSLELQRSSSSAFSSYSALTSGMTTSHNELIGTSSTNYYRVKACNSNGGCSYSNTVHVVTTINQGQLSAPQLSAVLGYCLGSAELSWTTGGGTRWEGESAFNSNFGNLDQSFMITETELTVNATATSWWRVRACNGSTCSGWSNSKKVNYYDPCL